MTTPALIVDVLDTERNHRREYGFARSPIRLGRSPLNDLPLEWPFVSHCHGIVHFDARHVEFVDLGSTNGTYLRGQRLARNRRTPLARGDAIEIGTLRLTVRIEERKTGDTRASYAFKVVRPTHDVPQQPAQLAASPEPMRPSQPAPAGRSSDMRIQQLNERFAQSFLELRRGQLQLLRDLGVTAPGKDNLQRIESGRELLDYLLDPNAPMDRLDELSRAYADLMMHEMALLNAIAAGSRELLDELSPESLVPGGLGRAFAWVMRLFGRDVRWEALRRKHEELQEETALTSVVLGRSFVRAYLAALGNPRADRPSKSGPDDT